MLSEDLIRLGNEISQELKEFANLYGKECGNQLLRHFANSLDLPDSAKLEVITNKGVKKFIHVSRLRKILAGSPPLVLQEGTVNKKEAAIALLRLKIHLE